MPEEFIVRFGRAYGRMAIPCEWCGDQFLVSPAQSTRKYCSRKCYYAATASPLGTGTDPRFWARVDQSAGPEGCWPYRGARMPFGHGQVYRHGRGALLAHRYAWELTHGVIPAGLWVLHPCDNPPCCNPAHLYLGTVRDNVDDMMAAGRAAMQQPAFRAAQAARIAASNRAAPRRGEANSQARLTEAVVRSLRAGYAAGETQKALAEAFGLDLRHVHDIVRRKKWRHLP